MVSGPKVVECRCHLNQCLQKTLLRLIQSQPNALPMLVCQEEFFALVADQAFRKRSAFPVERHTFSIGDLVSIETKLSMSASAICHSLRTKMLLFTPAGRTPALLKSMQQTHSDRLHKLVFGQL
jgi:hypothetical protein